MNSNKLKAAAVLNGLQMRDIIRALDMADQTFYGKMNGKSEFKLSEIRTLRNVLRLTDQQVNEIFFEDPEEPQA